MKQVLYRFLVTSLVCSIAFSLSTGCGSDSDADMSEFVLGFAAVAGDDTVGCSDTLLDLGDERQAKVGISDLRFYISNLEFWDSDGNLLDLALDDNPFQYQGEAGHVVLIDLTGNTEGSCSDTAIAFAEGTARTNEGIRGMTEVDRVARLSLNIGVPQGLMKEVIAEHSAESAPSPLNEMYWSWVTGYRHFVLNFVAEMNGERGDGYIHLGSRDCGPTGGLALEDRDECGFVNTPALVLDIADVNRDTVVVDILQLLADIDFRAPIYDPETFEPIGEGVGVECHSSPMQDDCAEIFTHFGIDMESGASSSAQNAVFSVQ